MSTLIRDEAALRGSIGPIAYQMMSEVFRYESPRFPRLASQIPAEDLLHEFFAQKGPGYVIAVLAEPDDIAAKRLTHKWVKHWLVDEDRRLPFGALRDRLETRLERSALFARSVVAHYWYLVDDADVDKMVTPDRLREAAAAVEVQITVSRAGQIQLGRNGQLENMLRALLVLSGRMHVSQMASICAERFPSLLDATDAMGQLEDDEWNEVEGQLGAGDLISATSTKLRSERSAAEIFEALSAQERIVLRHAADVDVVADSFGVGRSRAYSLIKQARAKVIELAGSSGQDDQIRGALIDLLVDKKPDVPS